MLVDTDTKSIRDAIDRLSETQKDVKFLLSAETGESISFRELKDRSTSLSFALRATGLELGDKVAFLMDNGLATAQIFLGAMYGGYVAVPLNVRAGAVQLTYMLEHCDAKVVYVAPHYSELLREALGGVRRAIRVIETADDGPLAAPDAEAENSPSFLPAENDVALLMYSSGSTGKPKAAIHTHSSILAHGRNSIESHRLTSSDRSLLVLPLYHINAECVTLIPTLLSGGSVVVAQRFAVSRFWDWIDKFHVTWSALVPTIISELVDWDDPGGDDRAAAFARIRFFRSSSAPLAPSLHQQFLDKFKLPLIQAMGSTEGGNIFSNPVPPGVNKIGSPGLPWGFEARIVDREGADVPPGESGEVLLKGPGLMRGYYKDAEGTSAVLDRDGWLHTGDLARRDEDGYFFVVGRSKELIIKGGVNIAPRQIDEVLESYPAVLEAAAVGVPDRYFGEDVVAFVVLRSEPAANEKELLAFCETRLGHFKTPSRIHFLKELPKGPSGKVQRLKLLEPDVLSSLAESISPASEVIASDGNAGLAGTDPLAADELIEQIVAEAWARALTLPAVDRNANFFALGGHSLLAIQCLSRMREKLPIVLSLADFFENSTVAEQVRLIRLRLSSSLEAPSGNATHPSSNWEQALLQEYVAPAEKQIPRRPDPTLPQPFGPSEQRLWFMGQLNPGVPVYNEAEAVRLKGDLNVEALEKALNGVVARHDVLRSTVRVIEGAPHWVVHQSWPVPVKKIDVSSLPTARQGAEIDRLLIDEPRVPYNLEAEPGVRFTLIEVSRRQYVFILMLHHLVGDWSSEGVFWRELSTLFRAILHGEAAILPALPIAHGDYVAWKAERLATESFEEDLAFWENTLRGAPALLELPADRPRPARMSHGGERIRWKINQTVTETLRDLSRREKTSLFTIFAAALDVLFYRYTGTDDISLGIPMADRDQPELQSMIGFLLHTHVLRTRLFREMTFHELLGRVQKGTLDLYSHRSVPFDLVVRRLQPERNLSYLPLFQIMLNWRDRDQLLPFIGLEGLAIESLMASADTSKFDMLLFATDNGDEIWLELEYSTDLYDKDRMQRMLGHYQALLESAVKDPCESIDRLSILGAEELHQILHAWNETRADYPADRCVHQLFEAQAAKTPSGTAISFGGKSLTYAELNRRANQLAHYLRELGVVPDSRVAICVERGFEMVIAILGVLKAGGAYVPLDPEYPIDRLQFMLRDSKPIALITESHIVGRLKPLDADVPVLFTPPSGCAWENYPELNPLPDPVGLTSDHLAYVIYTSGSTGRPKGVMGLHRSTVNRFWWMYAKYPFERGEICCARASLSFVDSIWELFGPLCAGTPVILIASTQSYDLAAFASILKMNNISRLLVVPSLLQAFVQAQRSGEIALPILKYWFTSGEALPSSLAEEFSRSFPRAKLVNLYGSSEDAGDVTCYEMASDVHPGPVPIGRPISNARAYILDSSRQPVPIGIPGEIFIGGDGIARGYFNLGDLTAERFLSDPFAIEPDARMFRTGDLGRWLEDGNIEYLGRNDHQVKIRGFRIELGEIEIRLEKLDKVRQCVVAVAGEDLARMQLVAYVVPADSRNIPGAEELRSALRAQLPDYMIPATFAIVKQLPMTANGKVDRKALKQANAMVAPHRDPDVPPRDAIEQGLVQMWEQLLAVRPIGIRSSFFDLGGHSLMAVSLFAQIKRVFQRPIPIAAIFGSPTIEQLAALIRGKALDAEASPMDVEKRLLLANSPIIPIKTSGSDAPLFLIHGAEGHLLGLYQLAMLSDVDRPMYGVQAQSFLREEPAMLRIEDQAAYYLSEIRKIQPRGPYALLGYCFGGLLALEIAQQLHERGEQVELLGILDTRLRSQVAQLNRTLSISTKVRRRVSDIFAYLERVSLKKKITYLPEKIWTHGLRGMYSLALNLKVRTVPTFLKNPEEIARVAATRYRPRPWPGSVTVFRASVQVDARMPEDLGWSSLAMGGVDIWEIPGDHFSVLHEPNIQILANCVRQRLERVEHEITTSARDHAVLSLG